MALSEQEQRILDELEKQLFAEDPTLAQSFEGETLRSSVSKRQIALGVAVVLAGLALLVFAVSIKTIWLGVVAFLIMVGGAAVMLRSPASRPDVSPHDPRLQHPSFQGTRAQKNSNAFMRGFEKRWDKRSGQ